MAGLGKNKTQRLIGRAQKGDAAAFEQLFEQEKLFLWRTARSVTHNDEDAADALQETAIKAWKALPGFDGRAAFSTWLTRILLNTCFDLRKRAAKVQNQSLADIDEPAMSSWESFSDDALDVQRALARLNVNDRLILSLFYANDLPVHEVAQILGVSEGAARTRLSRARARFKEAFVSQDSSWLSNGDATEVAR